MSTILMLGALLGAAGYLCWEWSRVVEGVANRVESLRAMQFEAETQVLLAGCRPSPTSPAARGNGDGAPVSVQPRAA